MVERGIVVTIDPALAFAQQRSWVTLVAQAGISGYVVWARSPGTEYRIPAFPAAPAGRAWPSIAGRGSG